MGGGRGLKKGLNKLDTKNCSSFSDRILFLDSSLAKSQFERYNVFTRLLRRDASSGSETHQQSARDTAHVRHSAVEETLTQRPPGPRPPRTRRDIHAVFHYSHKTRLSRCSRMYPGHSTCHPHPPQSDGYSGDKINWATRPGVTLWCLNLGRSDISHRFRFVYVSPYRVFHV